MRLHDEHDGETNAGDRLCRDCGHPFTVFASERKGFLKKGLEIPRRCRDCRDRRRKARAAETAGDRGPTVWHRGA